ncbi:unnamed protein product [Somion occarium]|uniref:Citrate transporter-like domain-containing protein n=1 Tax=Somion occarium TaxID=3059160 RepID=A0ABP1DW77_9APHY
MPVPRTYDAILTLVLFLLSNLAVIFPFRIPVPRIFVSFLRDCLVYLYVLPVKSKPPRRVYVHADYITVPLFSVLLLLATRSMDGSTIRRGVLGADGVEPLSILALFLSLAYISISLDFTGLFRFSAFWVARRGGTSGPRLYLYLYLFFLVSGIIVGNDPVILCGTPFLAYLTRVSGITPPTAWIFSQFAAANMASVVLVSSNPTNLVLTGAFSISFVSYSAHVILPFLAAATFVFPVLLFGLFRSPQLIPSSLNLDLSGDENESALVDKKGAVFGSVLMLATLALLAGTSTIHVPVWQITVPAGLAMMFRDIYHDWSYSRTLRSQRAETPGTYELQEIPTSKGKGDSELREIPASSSPSSPDLRESARFDLASFVHKCSLRLSAQFPTVSAVFPRLPIPVLPFAFLMFILIQGLSTKGWIELFSTWWAAWVKQTGPLGAVGGMAFISCLLCNFCGTNIGATILLARIIQLWESQSDNMVDPRTRDGAIYALAIGSNFGAFTITISASLAGLLWRGILRQKGIRIRPKQFLLLNLPISFVAMLVSCGVLAGEMFVIHRNDRKE